MALNGNTLTFGFTGTTTSSATANSAVGLILNGGTISGTGSIGFGTNTNNELDVYTSLGNGTINSNISSGNLLTKFGPGTLFLTGNNTALSGNDAYTSITGGAIDYGFMDGTSSQTLFTNNIAMYGGVLEGGIDDPLPWAVARPTRSILSRSGGFAARGGPLTVTIGGDVAPTLVGWSLTSFVAEGESLQLGSLTANNTVTFTNNLFLNGGVFNDRVVNVTANATDTALGLDPFSVNDVAVLSGVISSSDSFRSLSKAGSGVLKLTGTNTYTGATSIAGGVLIVGSDANLGTAPTAAYALNVSVVTTSGIFGGAITPGAVVIDSGATLATNTSSYALSSQPHVAAGFRDLRSGL